jgi:type VII secretion protein EccB
MRTRREQVQAHRFVTRRIVSALLSGEPETSELPMRRLGLALFGSVLVAAIVLAVVGVIGFVNPGGGRAEAGELVIMRETGARYVLVDRTLHPVLNWTSALLFAGSDQPAVRQMSRRSLSAYDIGAPIGIPGAPDPPPDRKALLRLPWSVCSVTAAGGSTAITTQVLVGRAPSGGAGPGDAALLVATGGEGTPETRYLIWDDRRFRVTDDAALTALDLAAVRPVRVGQPLVNSITAGPDLAPPRIPRTGENSARPINGAVAKIGSVYRSGQQFYVLLDRGLAPIGSVTARLLLARETRPPVGISAAEAANADVEDVVEPAGFPAAVPAIARVQAEATMVCAVRTGAETRGRTTSVAAYGPGDEQLAMPLADSVARDGADGVRTADRVLVASGRGALVRAQPAPDVRSDTTIYLITDQGYKYPLRDADGVSAVTALGYAGYDPVPVPSSVLALVPTGPTLDPRAARQFYRPGLAPASAPPTAVAPAPTPSSRSPAPSGSPSASATSSGSAGARSGPPASATPSG